MVSISNDLLYLESTLEQLQTSPDVGQTVEPFISLARYNLRALAEQVRQLELMVHIPTESVEPSGGMPITRDDTIYIGHTEKQEIPSKKYTLSEVYCVRFQ